MATDTEGLRLEAVIGQQKELASELQRLVQNYKKCALDKRTPEYLNDRLAKLDQIWAQFNEKDNTLRRLFEVPEDHEYFKNDTYASMGKIYNDVRNDMLARLQIQSKTSTVNTRTNEPQFTDKSQVRELTQKIKKQQSMMAIISNLLTKIEAVSSTESHKMLQLMSLQKHWEGVTNLHNEIWLSFDLKEAESYDYNAYFDLETRINMQLSQLEEPSKINTSTISMAGQVKLPNIPIPKFDGDSLMWRQFRDLFTEIIDKQEISKCQKLWYLKSSLLGEAAALIQHLPVTATNYDTAWSIITERYENPRMLSSVLIKRIISVPQTTETHKSIKLYHDTIHESLCSLNNIGINTNGWDPILLVILSQRLDQATYLLWEQSLKDPKRIPSMEEFLNFLKWRFQCLDNAQNSEGKQVRTRGAAKTVTTATTESKCAICTGDHYIQRCPTFLQLNPDNRLNLVLKSNLCVNCLRSGHKAKECSSSMCKTCKKRHNTLLHLESKTRPTNAMMQNTYQIPIAAETQSALTTTTKTVTHTILNTAIVIVEDKDGKPVQCRAILDNGSQVNIMTTRLAKRLGLRKTASQLEIEGIGLSKAETNYRVNVKVASTHTNHALRLEAHVMPRIVSDQPQVFLDIKNLNIPKNLVLADPRFNIPSGIDLLLGAGVFFSILSVGQISLGDGLPKLQNSLLGWLVGGDYKYAGATRYLPACNIATERSNLDESIARFWELEDIDVTTNNFTAAERRVEEHYAATVNRQADGRFVVRLPFRQDPSALGHSRDIALQRFGSLERKLQRNPELRVLYSQFMREYEHLGHMTEVSLDNITGSHFFLPHQAVMKPDSTTTKLRVVFDASAKSSTNVSLNDILAPGPTLQDDLFTILLRFRQYKYACTTDIEKMYRQIMIHEQDRNFQLVWWRENPDETLKCFQLNTVTYGTTSAPYLAIKTLKTVAESGMQQFPLASQTLRNNCYVDDILWGSDEITIAQQIQTQLINLLATAGFKLRKWTANHKTLLKDIPREDQEVVSMVKDGGNETVKTMGLKWNPMNDMLNINLEKLPRPSRITKRTALSDISQIFDPLGFIAPVVVTAKLFMQDLWKLKIDWDAALPQEAHTRWELFKVELGSIRDIKINRHLYGTSKPIHTEVHIFADASERAYGAVAYMRSIDRKGTIAVRFICAKSKVAPIKPLTLPRLELSAAVLATTLRQKIQAALGELISHYYMWTDSTIVLDWVNSEAANYKKFVANRVSYIQRKTSASDWRHVKTEQNPADLVSRGLTTTQLVNNHFWFYGPLFLHKQMTGWPLQPPKCTDCELEKKAVKILISSTQEKDEHVWIKINHKGSFQRLQRIIAYMLRMKYRKYNTAVPTATELDRALKLTVTYMQQESFADTLRPLKRNHPISTQNSLLSLSPFIDDDGILRVGGRLDNADLHYDAKHPMLLPAQHPFTKLLITDLHKQHLHVGAQALLGIIRQRFWPIKAKDIIRSVIKSCVHCTRMHPKTFQQMMGNLPADRVQPGRPFVISGVDFFGPLWIHYTVRGKRPTKVYVAVFCCFATKAIHMEVVSDLSTDAFIGALKRFVSRRGNCSKIYCDNATNFVGASNKLKEISNLIHSEDAQNQITIECNKHNMEFHFIPPGSPHFGGLWESAVKSAKHLLYKTVAAAELTLEELQTVVAQAEAILNSRPLTPLSNDPNDLGVLTAGHFLIGQPLTSFPDSNLGTTQLLKRWKLVTALSERFWKRWVTEYLNGLQQRHKWKQRCINAKAGTMVLIKDENTPSLRWPLGRILKVYKGDDGLVRVADVKTANRIIRRPIHKLAPLPTDNTEEEDQPIVDNEPEDTEIHCLVEPPRKQPRVMGALTLATPAALRTAANITAKS